MRQKPYNMGLHELKGRNESSGGHFFNPGTMRAFGDTMRNLSAENIGSFMVVRRKFLTDYQRRMGADYGNWTFYKLTAGVVIPSIEEFVSGKPRIYIGDKAVFTVEHLRDVGRRRFMHVSGASAEQQLREILFPVAKIARLVDFDLALPLW